MDSYLPESMQILNKLKKSDVPTNCHVAITNFLIGRAIDLPEKIYDSLYEYYCGNNEMPYGTQKARDGDPHNWIVGQIEYEFLPRDTDLSLTAAHI